MSFYWFVLGALATWRITHLLVSEDGPWRVVAKLRRIAGEGFWGTLMDCFYCLSLWISLPLAAWIGQSWKERVYLWLSLSAGAILLERLSAARPQEIQPAVYFEHGGQENAMLRSGTDATRSTAA